MLQARVSGRGVVGATVVLILLVTAPTLREAEAHGRHSKSSKWAAGIPSWVHLIPDPSPLTQAKPCAQEAGMLKAPCSFLLPEQELAVHQSGARKEPQSTLPPEHG